MTACAPSSRNSNRRPENSLSMLASRMAMVNAAASTMTSPTSAMLLSVAFASSSRAAAVCAGHTAGLRPDSAASCNPWRPRRRVGAEAFRVKVPVCHMQVVTCSEQQSTCTPCATALAPADASLEVAGNEISSDYGMSVMEHPQR